MKGLLDLTLLIVPLTAMLAVSGCGSPEELKVSSLLERQRQSATFRVANLTGGPLVFASASHQRIIVAPSEITSQLKQASGSEVALTFSQGVLESRLPYKFQPGQTVTFLVIRGPGGLSIKKHDGEFLGNESGQVVRVLNFADDPVTLTVDRGGRTDTVGPVAPGTEAEERLPVTIGSTVRVRLGNTATGKLPVREEDSFAAVVSKGLGPSATVTLLRTRVKSVPVAAGGS